MVNTERTSLIFAVMGSLEFKNWTMVWDGEVFRLSTTCWRVFLESVLMRSSLLFNNDSAELIRRAW